MAEALPAHLAALLEAWLPQQRWYPSKGSSVTLGRAGGLQLQDPSGTADLEVHFVSLESGDRLEILQVPLSLRREPDPAAERTLIGQATLPDGGERWVYDGTHDPVFIAAWLDFLQGGSTAGPESSAASSPAFRASRTPGTVPASKVLSGEQSNSSVIVQNGELPVIIKFFRVLGAGKNPDIEVGAALSDAGCKDVPAIHGWATGRWIRHGQQVEGNLCVMHEFIAGGEDVWSLATAAAAAGSDFTAQARALGAATANVHASLLSSMGGHQPTAEEREGFIEAIVGRIEWAWTAAGETVGPYRDQLGAVIHELRQVRELPPLQRIHGDLHLGQIIHAGAGSAERWLLLDFEGEPLRPVAERNRPDLPLRDVVGMLRSFDYAAASALDASGHDDGHDDAAATDRRQQSAAWAAATSEAFVAGYQSTLHAAVDPASPLFVALWLDKALYEVVYELRNRPTWVDVPARAVRQALNAKESGGLMANPNAGTTNGNTGGNDGGAAEAGAGEAQGATLITGEELAAGAAEAAPSAAPIPVDASVLAQLSEGTFYAPHSVLGAHLDDSGNATIRAVRHLAKRVSLVTAAGKTPMTHEYGGIWTVVVAPENPGHTPDYRIEAEYLDGHTVTGDDPYRYLPTLGEVDLHLIGEGRHETLWTALGAHVQRYSSMMGDITGVSFAVWAPNAQAVQVIGDFNGWEGRGHAMRSLGSSGVWEIFIPDVHPGACYKFRIRTRHGNWIEKADPMAFGTEIPPLTASRVVESGYRFTDDEWMTKRAATDPHNSPMSVYEVHLGSWRLGLGYKELAKELTEYVKWMGFTHVEFMPVAEHPFGGSWGYQVTSYFAPTSRFGHPDEFRHLVDELHRAGIGVLMDWVPAHFPKDSWALAQFDGGPLYEHSDPRLGEHPDWGTLIFDFGRSEVRNFLVANALYWLEEFHIDGLRVDAVASMLYLDYSRQAGQWLPNKYGGRENLEAISFLQEVNATAYKRYPGVITIAEESTAFPGVTAPTSGGGLGFGLKWNMGWMHDSLNYIAEDPFNRKWHHGGLTFSLVYAFTENFLLPISHDEVVHGKGSLLRKMPGDRWQQLANLRAFLAYQWAHPGKQLIFMGSEYGQESEWSEQYGLDWWLADNPPHRGVQLLVRTLNELYANTPALYSQDNGPEGFEWINGNDGDHNVLSFIRWDREGQPLVCIVNFAGSPHQNYRLGVPFAGTWTEVLNTDAEEFGGSGTNNGGSVVSERHEADGRPNSISLTVPPLGAVYFTLEGGAPLQVEAVTDTETAGAGSAAGSVDGPAGDAGGAGVGGGVVGADPSDPGASDTAAVE
jgi:1,4-alpha-glucan branching enzyme